MALQNVGDQTVMVDLEMELPPTDYPGIVAGLNVKSISTGTSHSCAALDNGSANVGDQTVMVDLE